MPIVIVSFLFIAFRLYTTIDAASVLTQQQIQAQEISINQFNLCVMVFWEIAAQLQNNREPDASLACAETDDPNIISRVGDDIIITHPHPELLGYSEIFIRRATQSRFLTRDRHATYQETLRQKFRFYPHRIDADECDYWRACQHRCAYLHGLFSAGKINRGCASFNRTQTPGRGRV